MILALRRREILTMNTKLKNTFFFPINEVGSITEDATITSKFQDNKTITVVSKYLHNSLLLTDLTERVYQLLQEDMLLQRERVNGYSHPRWL